MSLHPTLLATCFMGLGLLIEAPAAGAQVTSDTASPASSDSQAPPPDSAVRGYRAPSPDTSRALSRDTASADSARAVGDRTRGADSIVSTDSVRPAAVDTPGTSAGALSPSGVDSTPPGLDSAGRASGSAAVPDSVKPGSPNSRTSAAPADSILSAACSGAGAGTTVARDLLVIVFAPDAGAAERKEAAKTVDGRLLRPLGSAEPGAYYLRVPSGGNEYQLRLASDQLILLPQVRQVGSRACPPPAPPQKTR